MINSDHEDPNAKQKWVLSLDLKESIEGTDFIERGMLFYDELN